MRHDFDRTKGIGGSDAVIILNRDWLDLWKIKTGRVEAEDLTDKFQVQLGIFTEPFHRDWLNKYHNYAFREYDDPFRHVDYPFIYSHPDGVDDNNPRLICELKHSNTWKTLEEQIEYYMPQLQHNMFVCDAEACIFSVIRGNEEPYPCKIDRDEPYINELIELEQAFWHMVESDEEPLYDFGPEIDSLCDRAKLIPVNDRKPYDMTGNNRWASLSESYDEHKNSAALFEEAKKELKELVPDDASVATGYGITIKRDKRGALRFY